jgi:hypothetical protein
LKKDINPNPTDIKVSIKNFKTFRDGRMLIETGSEEEIKKRLTPSARRLAPSVAINWKSENKLRKPMIIIYNISVETTIENATDIIKAENPEILLNEEEISGTKPGKEITIL